MNQYTLNIPSTETERELARHIFEAAIAAAQEGNPIHLYMESGASALRMSDEAVDQFDEVLRRELRDQDCVLTTVESEPGWMRLRFDSQRVDGFGVALTYRIS